MKKVISAQTIKKAYKEGKRAIPAPLSDFIVTPEARSVAKELNIELVANPTQSKHVDSKQLDEALVRKIVGKIYERLPNARSKADEVKKAVIDVLSEYIR